MDSLAAKLRCIPLPGHVAKSLSIRSCFCCVASPGMPGTATGDSCGEVVNPAQPVVHFPTGRVAPSVSADV